MDARTVVTLILCFAISLVLSAVVTPVFCGIRKVFYVPFRQKKILKNAIASGHMVEARLIKRRVEHAPNNGHGRVSTGQDIGIYEYQLDGKIYRTRTLSVNRLPETMTLYYEKNPKKAVPADYVGFVERVWPRYYLIFCVIITAVIFMMRMTNG